MCPARIVEVFHGTTGVIANDILDGGRFKSSLKPWNWLGPGIYFWEEDLNRAVRWASEQFGPAGAVLRTRISLKDCLDLTKLSWNEYVAECFPDYREMLRRKRRTLPQNKGRDHDLDSSVLDYVSDKRQRKFKSVRAAFTDGKRLYPGSALFRLSHIEIAVRDESVIIGPTELEVSKLVWPKG
jgi:hypothetical protein